MNPNTVAASLLAMAYVARRIDLAIASKLAPAAADKHHIFTKESSWTI